MRHLEVTTVNIVWEGTRSQAVDPGWVPTRMAEAGAPDDLQPGTGPKTWLAVAGGVVPRKGGR
ncbi:hypothetical protein [Streptomyces sp. NPDC012466]|jgi:hypothetical protein|uniref:hypothetical protein n=1 Tax=Streptomyces sp. NPDC012466 TaxID=3364835 RepID=UPI0036E8248F